MLLWLVAVASSSAPPNGADAGYTSRAVRRSSSLLRWPGRGRGYPAGLRHDAALYCSGTMGTVLWIHLLMPVSCQEYCGTSAVCTIAGLDGSRKAVYTPGSERCIGSSAMCLTASLSMVVASMHLRVVFPLAAGMGHVAGFTVKEHSGSPVRSTESRPNMAEARWFTKPTEQILLITDDGQDLFNYELRFCHIIICQNNQCVVSTRNTITVSCNQHGILVYPVSERTIYTLFHDIQVWEDASCLEIIISVLLKWWFWPV